jgi:hypothetical protein
VASQVLVGRTEQRRHPLYASAERTHECEGRGRIGEIWVSLIASGATAERWVSLICCGVLDDLLKHTSRKMGFTMRLRINRRFQMTDAIVLIAATACGLAGCRFVKWSTKSGLDDILLAAKNEPLLEASRILALALIPIESIMLLSWTMAILLLRLRSAHPRRRVLWCQPGFLACVAAVFVFACKGADAVLNHAADISKAGPDLFFQSRNVPSFNFVLNDVLLSLFNFSSRIQVDISEAILLIWLVACAGGRCRPEPSWIDRSGRVLGAIWLCAALVAVSAMAMGPQ